MRRLWAGEAVTVGDLLVRLRARGAAARRARGGLDRRHRAARHRPRGTAGRRVAGLAGTPPRRRPRAKIAYYRERCRAHGRTPAAIALRRDVYVGENASEAKATGEAVVARGYRGFPRESLVIGSVDEVVAQLRPLAAMGYTDVIVRHLTDEQPKVMGSMARLADVRRALG